MPSSSPSDSDVRTLSDYARAAWRRKWLITSVAIACAAGAYYYSWRQPAQYKATTALIYQQPVDPSNPLAGSYYDPSIAQMALQNVASIIASPTVRGGVQSNLGTSVTHPYDVSASLNVGSTSTGYSNASTITVVSSDAAESAVVANAYAQTVIDWSREQQLARVRHAEEVTVASLRTYKTAVSKRSSDYAVLAQRLKNLRVLASTLTGQFQVLVQATIPTAPFAPRPTRSAVVGFAGGLLAAVAIVLLFEASSTRVRGRHDVSNVLGLPIVGVVPEVSNGKLRRGKLITLADPEGSAAEALRLLRSNLDYRNVDEVSSLLVTSCVSGEGKSTTVCNLAVTLAMAGKRIVVVDGDLRKPRVHEYFGLPNDVGLTNVVAGTAKLTEALRPIDLPFPVRNRRGDNGSRPDAAPASAQLHRLVVLTSGPRPLDPGELVASKRFGAVVEELQNSSADFVIVDSPALLEVGDAAAMAAQVEGLIMVVDADKVGRPTLYEAKDLLAPLPCHKLGAVLVRAKHGRGSFDYYSYQV